MAFPHYLLNVGDRPQHTVGVWINYQHYLNYNTTELQISYVYVRMGATRID